jgi:hypothetical protein
MGGFNLANAPGDVFQSLFPGCLDQRAVAPNERMGQATWIAGRMES